ncbi:MAG TPA: SRPBCC family protein [Streptosporangiaceae bacterium]|jgi:hypothetical protein
MRLEHTFHVALPVAEAWSLLTDPPRIAGCLPGAHLDATVDGAYRGGLSTRIGPVTATYRGSASFLERDDVDHRAVIAARGREERGSGTASATITARLRPSDGGTRVEVATDLSVTGRAARLGRGTLDEAGATLVAEFARRLEALAAAPAPVAGRVGAASRGEENTPNAGVPLMPLARRAAVPALVAVVAAAAGWLLGRRTR